MHSFSVSKLKCGTIGGGTLTEPTLPYTELSLEMLPLSEVSIIRRKRRNGSPLRHSFFTCPFRNCGFDLSLNQEVSEKDQFDNRRFARGRFSECPMNIREVATFQRRARRFIPDTSKPVPDPIYLYQMLYRAVRSTLYFVIALVSTALARNCFISSRRLARAARDVIKPDFQ